MSSENKLIFIIGTEKTAVSFKDGETLADVMRRHSLYAPFECGGRGICGKCRVICPAFSPVTAAEQRLLTGDEIKAGVRLACAHIPLPGEEIILPGEKAVYSANGTAAEGSAVNGGVMLAADIGTTTVAVKLINSRGEDIAARSFNNPQRAFGADVIGRISAACEGRGSEMRSALTGRFAAETARILEEAGLKKSDVIKCAVACNTAMGHILMGYDCSSLGVYPFRAQNTGTVHFEFSRIFTGSGINAPAVLLPGISAFVGGDIVAGIIACGMSERDEISMLIDLGTNGEIALGNKDRISVCSASAGPAFEGSSISCGTGSVEGAISRFYIAGGRSGYKTIGNSAPSGVCSSGVIDIAASLVKTGIADRTGLLQEEYRESGYPAAPGITFTQQDMRQVQSASAAIRTAIDMITESHGITGEDISRIYLAGGIGAGADVSNARFLGLIPRESHAEIITPGNTSLAGAVEYLTQEREKEAERIRDISRELILSGNETFGRKFIENMSFGV